MVKKRSSKASRKISSAKRGKKEANSNSYTFWKRKPVNSDTKDFDEVMVVLPLRKTKMQI